MPLRSQFDFLDGLHVEPKAEVITETAVLEPCQFPVSNDKGAESSQLSQIDINVSEKVMLETTMHNVSRFQWIQTAWAILLRCYVGNDSVSFGVLPIRQDDELVNRQLWLSRFVETSEIMACQLQPSDEDPVLATIQWVSLSKHPRGSLEANDIKTAVTLPLSFPSRHRHQEMNHYLRHLRRRSAQDFDMILNATEDEFGFDITLNYNRPRISTETASNVAATFENILSEMALRIYDTIGDLHCLSYRDLQQIEKWNSNQKPKYHFECVHHVFESVAKLAPSSQAVCAWDGSMTHNELNRRASAVARQLVDLGVGPGVYVPFCFEKSIAAVVATLAILKAGAAFVPLDPDHPIARTSEILVSVDARVVVASPLHAHLFTTLVDQVVIVSPAVDPFPAVPADYQYSSPLVTPQDPAFVLFTSGSTGRPKGIIQEHLSVVSNAFAHGRVMHYRKDSRVLQFAAHTFDVAQMDVFTTLLHGGCVCIPSEEDRRNDIISVFNTMQVNWALLTPSFASLIHPHQVPSLHTLALGGEALTKESTNRWASKLLLINCYGPAECGACLTLEVDPTSGRAANNVGFPLPNSTCWLVHPDDHDKLVPIGAVGELLVGGPNLARGYLNDEEKTKRSFIENPCWARDGGPSRRFYKTGDLLKYNNDGSMDFVGRKDSQIKLRGQRVELGEVEHHISTMPEIAVSMVVSPKAGCYANELVAIVQLRGRQPHSVRNDPIKVISDPPLNLQHIKAHVESVLPTYMIPTVCIVVQNMPFTPSLKVNRKLIGSWLDEITTQLDTKNGPIVPVDEVELLNDHETVAFEISAQIADIVARNDNVRRMKLEGRDFALHAAGIDSIQIISLSMFLQKTFQVKLPLSVLLSSKTTIRSLARYVKDAANGSTSYHIPVGIVTDEEVSDMSRQLADWIASNSFSDPIPRSSPVHNVLLTGVTGFLGLNVLKELLTQSQLCIIALVRAPNAAHGLDRIVQGAKIARWWHDSYSPRLKVWVGDLAETTLGLSKIHWQQLTGHGHPEHAVHAIIHNGAKVHWNSDYAALKATNVNSTLELLKAASISPALTNFVFVSGGQLPNASLDEESRERRTCKPGGFQPNTNGYSQSKLVSELLVERYVQLRKGKIQADVQQNISIVKPGYIIGTATDGVANQQDFIWRLVAACIDINAYSEVDAESWLFIADVQRVASAVVASMMSAPSTGLNGEHLESAPIPAVANSGTHEPSTTRILSGLPQKTFWSLLCRHLGYALQSLPHKEWLARLQEVVAAKGPSHVFFPFLHTLEQDQGHDIAVMAEGREVVPVAVGSGEATVGLAVEETGGEKYGSGDVDRGYEDIGEVVRRNVEYLIGVGFLAPPPAKGGTGA